MTAILWIVQDAVDGAVTEGGDEVEEAEVEEAVEVEVVGEDKMVDLPVLLRCQMIDGRSERLSECKVLH